MPVSRETVSSFEELHDIISCSEYYKHLFDNDRNAVLSNCVPGFVSLLFSIKTLKKNAGVSIVAEDNSISEKLFIALDDLLTGSVYFAQGFSGDVSRPLHFTSEEEKNFESAFTALISDKNPVIITTASVLQKPVRGPCQNNKKVLIKKSSQAEIDSIRKTLISWGYKSVDSTTVPNSYSVRGGIMDIFPLYARVPIRIEFFGANVESIRSFNPVSQLSISNKNEIELFAPSGFTDEKKISFNEFLKNHIKENFYLKSGLKGLSISNNVNYQGPVKRVDCVPSVVDSINKDLSKHIFVFGSNKPTKKKVFENRDDCFIVSKPLRFGFTSKSLNVAVFGYMDLNTVRPPSSSSTILSQEASPLFGLSNIKWGDYVVHEDYGLGKYRGLSFIGDHENRQDSISIEYAGGGTVKVPLDRFDKIHKYVSSGRGAASMSRLGAKSWQTQLTKTKKSIQFIVKDLVKIHSSRQQPRGFLYSANNEFVDYLAASFPFDETQDQKAAIVDTLKDLDKPTPMDRIVLGDVGFGKTEVAFRGAMKVIASGKQVFFLAPTTILTDQHFITAKNRLEHLGVKIDLISRFQSKKDHLLVFDKIKNNSTDLIIGTHKLLSKDVDTKNLGLLIIDEEHRFGVKHKEQIRIMKKDVDVLTLTATPIPRTLQQSLLGVRDISHIDTPPQERLPIKTIVQYFTWLNVKNHIYREVSRGGQVYFLHNDIQSIPFMVEKIKKIFPDFIVASAHGSMPSKQLEKNVLLFFNGGVDVLVCTTIIESGLDVTNANTVIINNAHRLGLAQLYQIRGRVGRGNLQAYCWLMVPNKTLNENANERLKAIEHHSALGSGYQISLKDLAIRGSGSLFGYEQSGHINQIGYDMYCKMLKEEVDKHLGVSSNGYRGGRPQIAFQGPAYFSDSYVPLAQDRVYYYQRLSLASGLDGVIVVQNEIIDRFGCMPHEANNVLTVAKIREQYAGCGIKKISIENASVSFCFLENRASREFNLLGVQNFLSSTNRVFCFENSDGFTASINTDSIEDSTNFLFESAELMQVNL